MNKENNTFGFGFIVGMSLMTIIMFISLHFSLIYINKNRVIVYTTNTGIICKKNKDYPNIYCSYIKNDIGLKRTTFKVEGK